jgi:hypothetical protein
MRQCGIEGWTTSRSTWHRFSTDPEATGFGDCYHDRATWATDCRAVHASWRCVLRVYYGADGRVAGLSTTSAYYTTPSGCGFCVNDSAASRALAGQSAGTYASLLGPGSLCMSDLREAVEPGRP